MGAEGCTRCDSDVVFTDVTAERIWAYYGRAVPGPCGAGLKGVRRDRGTSFGAAELRPELIFDLRGRSSLSHLALTSFSL